MSENTRSTAPRDAEREMFWRTYVVPTAKGVEAFAWRVAWFAVVVKVFFFA